MPKQRGDQAVVEALLAEGVEYVFGLPGGHSCDILYDALYDSKQIKAVLCRHEEAGAFEAFGYSHITGKVGICHGTAGPGWAQLLPGVHEAYAARMPMIAICAAVTTSQYGMGAIQEFPQMESMIPFCKWVYKVDRTDKIPWVMRRAFTHALSNPPGPVFVEIPTDVGCAQAEMLPYRRAPVSRSGADPADVGKAAQLLAQSERPIIIAGRGVHMAAAWSELRQLAEMLVIPVLTTNSGKGAIAENHPLSAGGVGINRTDVSQAVYDEADCMFWIGSQIEGFSAGSWDPIPAGRKFIHADADPNQFGRNWVPDVTLAGDAKLVLRQLIEACQDFAYQGEWEKSPRVAALRKLWNDYEQQVRKWLRPSEEGVHPFQVVREVEQQMEDDAIIVLGEGANRVWTASHLRLRSAGNWVSSSEYGCMGLAVPAAIGAKLGRPDSQVIAITGDGSFQMQMQELPVALQYSAPVTWIVMNNNCLGWIKFCQERGCQGRYIAVDFDPNWRFDQVAQACGCFGVRVENSGQLKAAIAGAFEANRQGQPAVVEVMIPEMEQTPGFLKRGGG